MQYAPWIWPPCSCAPPPRRSPSPAPSPSRCPSCRRASAPRSSSAPEVDAAPGIFARCEPRSRLRLCPRRGGSGDRDRRHGATLAASGRGGRGVGSPVGGGPGGASGSWSDPIRRCWQSCFPNDGFRKRRPGRCNCSSRSIATKCPRARGRLEIHMRCS